MAPSNPIFRPATATLTVGVLVMPEANAFSLAACVDPMRAANRRAGRSLFDWRFLSPTGRPSPVTAGFSVDCQPLDDRVRPDLLMVIAGFRLEEQATPELLTRLRRLAPRLSAVGGVDGGSWFLARAGLLDGHRATTHWEDLETFASRFPAVDVRRDRYVISGPMITTGGAAPCLDLMLELIRARHGVELALRTAGAFLYEPEFGGAMPQRGVPARRIGGKDPVVGRAIALMEASIEQPQSIAEIAATVGLSQRRIEMLFAEHLATSPGRFFLDLRLDEARRMITDTGHSIQEIALRTGFASQTAFARAFRARFQTVPSALRARP